jgi:hypothetical protein
MSRKGRRQKLKTGAEYNFICARSRYTYLKNGKRVKHNLKRQLNRRYRRELNEETKEYYHEENITPDA